MFLLCLQIGDWSVHKDIDDKTRNLTVRQVDQAVQMESLFFELADTCSWIGIHREHFEKIGLPIVRRSDGRPIEMFHLYACMNFKDY